MSRLVIILTLMSLSCLKLEFEAPYEDINGIYLEWIGSYNQYGNKILFDNDKIYILSAQYLNFYLTCYTFSEDDAIHNAGEYTVSCEIADFAISGGFAYLAVPSYGLEIVNYQSSYAYLYGDVEIEGGLHMVKQLENYVYAVNDSGLYTIDVSNKSNPQRISEYVFDTDIRCMETMPGHVYILLRNNDFFILGTENPQGLTLKYKGTIDPAFTFAIKENFLYFLTWGGEFITYAISDSYSIELVSSLRFPDRLDYLDIDDIYGVAFTSHSGSVYLINLEYPSRPCISEILDVSQNPDYAIVEDDHIYILTPYLNIVAIREVPR